MDDGSPAARVERTFWTVWYYISEAVNRFFRPEAIRNDPNSFQESAVDSDPANDGHAESDAGRREVNEEQPVATASELSSCRPVVEWEVDLGPGEESMLSKESESIVSDEGEGKREEQFVQTGNDDAKEDGQEEDRIPKSSTHEQDETHVDTILLKLTADAVSEDVEESERKPGAEEAQETERTMAPDDLQKMDETITKISIMEEVEKSHREDEQDLKAEDVEVILSTITTLSLDEEDSTYIKEASLQGADTAVVREVECSDGLLLLASENKTDKVARQVENQLLVCEELSDDERDFKGDSSFTLQNAELEMADNGSAVGSEDALIVVAQERKRKEEKEDENTVDEMAQGAVTEEENANVDEVPEQEGDIKPVTGENISTAHLICSEEFTQDARTELHTVESTDGEEEDVTKDTEGKSKTRETGDVESEGHGEVINRKSDMTAADVSADERFYDKDRVEEESPSSKVGDVEVACTTTAVTVKPEGETGPEVSGGVQNIPQGICEGGLVVSQALNSPPCEETQEGVPDYNNEPGPNENTTQMFLEGGDCEETQNMHLPEEVESREPENLQNRAEYLMEREHMEEGNPERIDLVVEEHPNAGFPQETETPLVEPVVQEPGISFEEEEEKLSVDSMKTGIEYSGYDFGLSIGVSDEEPTGELQDGLEEILVEIDEGLCDFEAADAFGDGCEMAAAAVAKEVVRYGLKFLEPEIQMMTETTLFEKPAEAVNLQNRDRTSALFEDFTETGFLKQSVGTESNSLDDSTEMQDAGIDMDETCYEVEMEAAEDDKVQNKNETDTLNLQVAGMAGEPNTERNEEDGTLIAEAVSLEATQLSDEALEISNEETEAADESMMSEFKPDMTVISAEEEAKHEAESGGSHAEESPISQDVIDEEILDLWIQTALSEDTDGIKQLEGPQTGQHIDAGAPSSEKHNEVLSIQTEKKQLVEINSEQSEMVCETEMSSSTAESGFLDQSPCELSSQSSETQLLNTVRSFQGIHDMLADMSESADISEVSTQEPTSESQDLLMEGIVGTEQSYLNEESSRVYTDSEVTSSEDIRQYQESDKSQETKDEETGSKELVARVTDAEEADVQSLTNKSPLVKTKETKGDEEPLEAAVSDSLDEIEHTDLERSRSGSEASVGEEVASEGSGPQGNTYSVSEEKLLKMPSLDKSQPRWSNAIIDSLPGFDRNEMVEQQTMEPREQMKDEVQVEVLDFTAQKSRIAVKNPLVRPPKDPRSLLHMPSMDPTPTSHQPVKITAGVPLGGLGIGIKLPGFGAGFPVLKKTQRAQRDNNSQETVSQEPESKPVEKSDSPEQDETQRKPKWTPPRHPGFGNPLMSELKNKLKKTPKDD